MKRKPNETVDCYYNQFHELLEDISGADDKISLKSSMRHFIFTLGPEFEPIQHQYRIGNLPSAWHTTHWPSLLVLCRDFYNSVHPTGILPKDNYQEPNSDKTAQHHRKVKQWFLFPAKFCKDIAAEQAKNPGMFIYHLSSTHATENCHIKLDCDKCASARKPSSSVSNATSSTSTGQLRHITEEFFEDASDVIPRDDSVEESNDTNEAELLYFAQVSNHYLRLVKSVPSKPADCRHNMDFPVIADSGANYQT